LWGLFKTFNSCFEFFAFLMEGENVLRETGGFKNSLQL
jgi:hypothetical protein